jgi:hypothetical protein
MGYRPPPIASATEQTVLEPENVPQIPALNASISAPLIAGSETLFGNLTPTFGSSTTALRSLWQKEV